MIYNLASSTQKWNELPEVEEKNIKGLNTIGMVNGDLMDYFLKILEIETGVSQKYKFLDHTVYDRIDAAVKDGSWLAVTNHISDLNKLHEYDYVFVPILKNGLWSLAIIGYGLEREFPVEGPVMFHIDFSQKNHNGAEVVQNLKRFIRVQRHVSQRSGSAKMRTFQIPVTGYTNYLYSGVFAAGFIDQFVNQTGAVSFCYVVREISTFCSNFIQGFKLKEYKRLIYEVCHQVYETTPKPMLCD